MSEDAFAAPGEWLRGNLHLHTTESDGTVTPQEAVELYAGAGYDFLAITDHGKVTDPSGLDACGMTLLPGVEIAPKGGELGQTIHTVAIGITECPPDPQNEDPQPYISAVSELAQFCFVAHPSWSSLTCRDIVGLEGIAGVEVYNSVCHHGIGRGTSEVQWDDCLARGKHLYGLAVDDAHHKFEDRFYGYIMLKSEDRSPESIIAALQAGRFYASTGPRLESVQFDGDVVRIECSPCVEFFVISPQPGRGQTNWREGVFGEPMTSCELHFAPDIRPIRIAVVDEQGRRAWSNPYWGE